jgi:hypothetical protein
MAETIGSEIGSVSEANRARFAAGEFAISIREFSGLAQFQRFELKIEVLGYSTQDFRTPEPLNDVLWL